MRYFMQIASDPLSSLSLSLFNVNTSTAYVELTSDSLIVKEGNLFHEKFDLSNLQRAELIPWPWYAGVGVRSDFQGLVAAVTSCEKVVCIPLLQEKNVFVPILGPVGLQLSCKRLAFSLQDANAFLTHFNADRADPSGAPTQISID
jgi:hypothetical protein